MAAVAVVIAPFFATIINATCWAIGLRNLSNVLPMVLIGLPSISVLIGHLEHLIDHLRRLPIELCAELIVVIEPMDEC